MDFKNIVKKLTKKKMTISTMESCTGGAVVSSITDIEGASDVLKFSAVTYCNEAKIKLGVKKVTIDEFSVYSMEVAEEMALSISNLTNSDIGIGITGKLNRVDKNNPFGADNIVFICIYDKRSNKNYNYLVEAKKGSRHDNKKLVIDKVIMGLDKII